MSTLALSTVTRQETLSSLLARQRAAFLRHGPPSLVERRANLKKLRAALLARKADFEAALDADFGHRSRHETGIMETLLVTWGIDYLHKNLRRFMQRERRHVALPMRRARAYVESQPLGIVGIVAPWNYPFSLALMPLATALAAGNRAMMKPSELTPATSNLLVSLIAETFSEDEVAVITGDASVGAAFSALPFDHLFFTGSTAVGRAVMRAGTGDAGAWRQVPRAGRSRAAARARRDRHRLRQVGERGSDVRRARLHAAARVRS